MGDGRLVALTTAPGHVLVQVRQASGHGLCHVTQLVPRDDVPLEVIREGALEEAAQSVGTGQDQPSLEAVSGADGCGPLLGGWR